MPPKQPLVLSFAEEQEPALRLAHALSCDAALIDRRQFPDGESLVTVKHSAPQVVFYQGLHQPNAKLLDLLLATSALRDQGCEHIILVAPYMPYMRQDVAFHPGEAVSQRVIGDLLAAYVDAVITVDPHLHRTKDLAAVFPQTRALALSAAGEVGRAVAMAEGADVAHCVLIGPDEESEPLIGAAARAAGCFWLVGRKERHGDREVVLTLPDAPSLDERKAIIFDDIISSGTTIKATAQAALERGATSVDVYVTHALFTEEDEMGMRNAGVSSLVSCDGIPHTTNGIALAPLLAEGVRLCL